MVLETMPSEAALSHTQTTGSWPWAAACRRILEKNMFSEIGCALNNSESQLYWPSIGVSHDIAVIVAAYFVKCREEDQLVALRVSVETQ